MRFASGGLSIASGAWSVWQGFFPAMGRFMMEAGGMGGTARALISPVPVEFNIAVGFVVLITGIVVIVRKMGRSPWPGAAMLVYGILMTVSGVLMINWIFSNAIFVAGLGLQGIALSFLMPGFGVAMLASGSFMLLRRRRMGMGV